jgi:DNA-binding MarR family transcriptional regulator
MRAILAAREPGRNPSPEDISLVLMIPHHHYSMMKTFQDDRVHSHGDRGEAETAEALIEVSVWVMRWMRAWLRNESSGGGLTFTQGRALGCIGRTPGVSLSEVSEHLGLQAPTTSKTIEELVQLEMVIRETAGEDRRRVTLRLTDRGEEELERVTEIAARGLAELLAPLGEEDQTVVRRAVSVLLPLLVPTRTMEEVTFGE